MSTFKKVWYSSDIGCGCNATILKVPLFLRFVYPKHTAYSNFIENSLYQNGVATKTFRMRYHTTMTVVELWPPTPPHQHHHTTHSLHNPQYKLLRLLRLTEGRTLLYNFLWTKYRGCNWFWTSNCVGSLYIKAPTSRMRGQSASP